MISCVIFIFNSMDIGSIWNGHQTSAIRNLLVIISKCYYRITIIMNIITITLLAIKSTSNISILCIECIFFLLWISYFILKYIREILSVIKKIRNIIISNLDNIYFTCYLDGIWKMFTFQEQLCNKRLIKILGAFSEKENIQ